MDKPNFIVILTDDQGYGDLSCMGNTDFKTPNIDRIATNGARFTSWYANAPICSPSRASFMTGLYPFKAGIRGILKGDRSTRGLLKDNTTIAKELNENGYNTGFYGKWHMGSDEESKPHNQGFKDWIGFYAGNIDYYSHVFYYGWTRNVQPLHDLWENDIEINRNGEYITELITEKTVEFIRKSVKDDKPFFAYTCYNAPHYPMHAPQKYLDRFPNLPPDRKIMAAMLSAVDDGVGNIIDELERLNVLENTCILYLSDNGPSRESRNWMDGNLDYYYGGRTGILKGHKGSLYEGGIRVPAVISWPDKIKPGIVINEPALNMDVLPTFVKAAGVEIDEQKFDGKDILPMLTKKAPCPHEKIFWEMPDLEMVVKGMHAQQAIRKGKWKLVIKGRNIKGAPPEDDIHLSNLEEDMGEKVNLKDKHPDILEELRKDLDEWYQNAKNYSNLIE